MSKTILFEQGKVYNLTTNLDNYEFNKFKTDCEDLYMNNSKYNVTNKISGGIRPILVHSIEFLGSDIDTHTPLSKLEEMLFNNGKRLFICNCDLSSEEKDYGKHMNTLARVVEICRKLNVCLFLLTNHEVKSIVFLSDMVVEFKPLQEYMYTIRKINTGINAYRNEGIISATYIK